MTGGLPYFDEINADAFLATLMDGMARAQDRFNAKLRTVDENGNPIEDPTKKLEEKK